MGRQRTTRSITPKEEDPTEEAADAVGTSADVAPDGEPDPSASQAESEAPAEGTETEESAPEPKKTVEVTYNIGDLPIRGSWRRASVADLETEIRGWSDVERLPEDHGLSRQQLVGYLAVLNKMADEAAHPATWPDYSIMEEHSDLEFDLDELPEEAAVESEDGDTPETQPAEEEAST